MFKLREISLNGEYTDAEMASSMSRVSLYADAWGLFGVGAALSPDEDMGDCVGTAALLEDKDATILTIQRVGDGPWLIVIPLSNAERTFVNANEPLLDRVSNMFGCKGYKVAKFEGPTQTNNLYVVKVYTQYDWTNTKLVEHIDKQVLTTESPDKTAGLFWTDYNVLFSRLMTGDYGSWSALKLRGRLYVPLEVLRNDAAIVDKLVGVAVNSGTSTVQSLKDRVDAAGTRLTELSGQVTSVNESVASLSSDLGATSADVTSIDQRLTATEAGLVATDAAVAAAATKFVAMEHDVRKASEDVASLSSKVSSINAADSYLPRI